LFINLKKMNKYIKTLLYFIGIILIFGTFFYFINNKNNSIDNKEVEIINENIIEEVKDFNEVDSVKLEREEREAKNVSEEKILEKILIQVPFTVQAPFAIWDEYHEEACEEASLIMVAYFLKNKKLNPEISEQEIQALIKFQIESYGDYRDSSAKELVKLAKDFYGIKNLEAVYDFSQEDLKKYLSQGNPIIIPVAGRLLGNPYFKAPGPLYHNLVLVGYNGDRIITNDPGTKRGEKYSYDAGVLYRAIHDFTGKKENIEKGRKAIIIVK